MDKYSRIFILLVGLYFLVTLIMGINNEQFHMLKSDKIILLSEEPEKFWAIVFIQAIVFLLCVVLYFPKLSMITFFSKRTHKSKASPLDKSISEIEVCLTYGRVEEAFKLLQTLLSKYPDNEKLLALHEKLSNK